MSGSTEACIQNHDYKHKSNAFYYNVKGVTMSLGTGKFQIHYNLMGPPSYMQFNKNRNITIEHLTVFRKRYDLTQCRLLLVLGCTFLKHYRNGLLFGFPPCVHVLSLPHRMWLYKSNSGESTTKYNV